MFMLAAWISGCASTEESEESKGSEPAQTVETGCAACMYDMEGSKGCETAVKIDGMAYLVKGAGIDAHGAGLCDGVKKAKVAGSIGGSAFKATSFELVDE
jgi:hypothetical protein